MLYRSDQTALARSVHTIDASCLFCLGLKSTGPCNLSGQGYDRFASEIWNLINDTLCIHGTLLWWHTMAYARRRQVQQEGRGKSRLGR